MTATDDKPTVGERYSSAVESSNLKLGEKRGDVDFVIAAGLVEDGFGLTLYRLMTEFDQVRGPVDAAKRWVSSQMQLSSELAKQAAVAEKVAEFAPGTEGYDSLAVERARRLNEASRQVKDAALASMRTELALVLSVMGTLREARYAVGNFAQLEAWRKGVKLDAEQVRMLSGRVLDVFLDPLCAHCDGRGYNGGGRFEETGPQVFCRPCRNSGQRRDSIGKSDVERVFAGHLLMQMDADLAGVQAAIRRALRHVDKAKSIIAQAGVSAP